MTGDRRVDRALGGRLVLTFNKTIDLLGQVREMLEDVWRSTPDRQAPGRRAADEAGIVHSH
jgi:hypothetical protein